MAKSLASSLQWSTAGEALAKLVAPITNMVLARVLVPEDFGVVATVNMIITFVDLFTDSGFAKYIIQSDFKDEKELDQYVNVAFWTNLFLSVFLWFVIFALRTPIANLVGNAGQERVIVIAASQLIITSFSSIQTSILRRFFEFRILFTSRVLTSIVPLCITVPLAFIVKNYWALVIGAIIQQLINAVFLTIKSSWKPARYYSVEKLKKMLSFSIWSLAEALAYWMTTWFDVFIIGTAFTAYYLGLYKNSINMVNSVMQLVKASIIPVLFSSLSRLKNDNSSFFKVYLRLQEGAAFFLIPIGIGLLVYRDLATDILFGSKWVEAASIVGAWALSSCLTSTFVNFFGEALKAKGKPKVLFVYEVICLLIIVPTCLYARNLGFWPFVYTRVAASSIQILIGLITMKCVLGFPINKMIGNVIPVLICSVVMGTLGVLLRDCSQNVMWQMLSIVLCALMYFAVYLLLFKGRLKEVIKTLNNKDLV